VYVYIKIQEIEINKSFRKHLKIYFMILYGVCVCVFLLLYYKIIQSLKGKQRLNKNSARYLDSTKY